VPVFGKGKERRVQERKSELGPQPASPLQC
jgi:hypothetical protein